MPFRFRRRVRLAKGVYVNLGKRGITSMSVGRRGTTMNVNRKGTRETYGIPGTGMSYQTKRRAGCLGCGSMAVIFALAAGVIVGLVRRR